MVPGSEQKLQKAISCNKTYERFTYSIDPVHIQYRPSIYRASRGKGNMYGISNYTVYRISIYISLLIKVVNLGNENWAWLIEYTVNRSPVNRGFTLYFCLLCHPTIDREVYA